MGAGIGARIVEESLRGVVRHVKAEQLPSNLHRVGFTNLAECRRLSDQLGEGADQTFYSSCQQVAYRPWHIIEFGSGTHERTPAG